MPATYSILTAVSSDLVRETFVPILNKRAEKRREPLMLSMVNDAVFENVRFLVPHKVNNFLRTTLNTAITTTTNTDLTVVLDNLTVFPIDPRKNEMLQIDSEFFIITAEPVVTSTTITCTCQRGTGTQMSSTAATHSAAATVYLLGRILSEGSDFDRSSHVTGTRRESYCQIFKWEFQQTRSSGALDGVTVGDDNNAAAQIMDGVDRIYQEIQANMFQMKKSGSATITNSNTNVVDRRTLSGIGYWQSTYSGISTAAGSAQISPDMLDSDIQTIIKRGGGVNPETGRALGTGSTLICVINETQKTFVNRFLNNRIRVDQKESTLRNFVGTYQAQANVDFVVAPEDCVRPSEYFLYDPKTVVVAPCPDGFIQQKELAITSDTKRKMHIVAEMGCAMFNPELSARTTGLATS